MTHNIARVVDEPHQAVLFEHNEPADLAQVAERYRTWMAYEPVVSRVPRIGALALTQDEQSVLNSIGWQTPFQRAKDALNQQQFDILKDGVKSAFNQLIRADLENTGQDIEIFNRIHVGRRTVEDATSWRVDDNPNDQIDPSEAYPAIMYVVTLGREMIEFAEGPVSGHDIAESLERRIDVGPQGLTFTATDGGDLHPGYVEENGLTISRLAIGDVARMTNAGDIYRYISPTDTKGDGATLSISGTAILR